MGYGSGGKMRLLIAYGTRPEFIKIKPIVEELKRRKLNYKLVQIGQHTTLLGEEFHEKVVVFEEEGSNRLDCIVRSILSSFFLSASITHVLVQGDTTTSLGVALAAFHRNIPIIHLEAGLRTYDKDAPYPEEVNRRMISAMASVHLCPTARDKQNLFGEKFRDDEIFVTGNTVIDNIVGHSTSKNKEVIITMHRRENQARLGEWFSAIEDLSFKYGSYSYIFPMHPSPKVQRHRNVFKNVKVCEPFSYNEMKERLAACELVITDSGGIQEECSYFKKVCFVCRNITERPSYGSIMCPSPADLINNFGIYRAVSVTEECPFGDGNAAIKIADIIENF
jgi:UDP-N-acetylglucosamine 2-epimerase (non-hydrolysing)